MTKQQLLRPTEELEGTLLPSSSTMEEIPIAVPVYLPLDDQHSNDASSVAFNRALAAQILPTYEMASTSPQYREQIEKEQIRIAESIARVKLEQERQKDQKGVAAEASKKRNEARVVDEANRVAILRNAEGIEIKEDKWLKAGLALKQSKEESIKAPEPSAKKVSAYQVREYETSEYVCREYQSNYEYKSVYD